MRDPVLTGATEYGDTFVIDTVTATTLRVFAAEAGQEMRATNADVFSTTTASGTRITIFGATDEFFSGGAVEVPLVPHADELLPDYDAARVGILYPESEPLEPVAPEDFLSHTLPLRAVDSCEAMAQAVPPRESWLGIEYFYQGEDGSYLLVMELLAFRASANEAEYFLFFGPAESALQRDVVEFTRDLDGATDISFRLPDAEVTVSIPASCPQSNVSRFCPAEMLLDEQVTTLVPIAQAETGARLDDVTFSCAFEAQPIQG